MQARTEYSSQLYWPALREAGSCAGQEGQDPVSYCRRAVSEVGSSSGQGWQHSYADISASRPSLVVSTCIALSASPWGFSAKSCEHMDGQGQA